MKKIAISIAIVAAVAIAAVLLFAATKPDTFQVQRATTIKAPPEVIFPLINDYRNWATWSPYEKKDPAMKKTYSGAPRGKGAVYEWEGNKNVGKGRMEIVDAVPPFKVTIKLDFSEPFEAHNSVEFTLTRQGDSTRVAWEMQGPASYVSKVMQVFVDMDRMVGADFEAGLARLRTLAETR